MEHGDVRPQVTVQELGLVDYATTWEDQTRIHRLLIDRKRQEVHFPDPVVPHQFILCEHPHVYTLGKSGHSDHLLLDEEGLDRVGATFFRINRGGDITYHGPGQIVGYPILDLEDFYRDVHRYVRELEEVIIRVIAEYGLTGQRLEGYTGVWLPPDDRHPIYRKICAIGVHLSRWVTLHGFAFNVNTDLSYFGHIVPCGIDDRDKGVTSMANELGASMNLEEVQDRLKVHFAHVFHCDLTDHH
ncbi:MAG: lipoyl(octanoyl) transferase LipB [Lewinellaceae bacterium]|nr:lipoyl(octanoyl) transferase LipB [Saprospiraceae bacterium]MCB9311630.1 lipoyl(octanoyl) transferase LipB [Lewinellaceae bacterium]HRW76224.1 lipoyl(octanoyl) transferase LipB [Saprospiraceae bacterium]